MSEVPFWIVSASYEFCLMTAWLTIFLPRCIASHRTSPADFWSAQLYDVFFEVLAIERNSIDSEERACCYLQTCSCVHCSLPSLDHWWRCQLKLVPVRITILTCCHYYGLSINSSPLKSFAPIPWQHNFFKIPLVWNLIQDILKSQVCYMYLMLFVHIITDNTTELQKPHILLPKFVYPYTYTTAHQEGKSYSPVCSPLYQLQALLANCSYNSCPSPLAHL